MAIHEKRGPGQIEIKIEDVQVRAARIGDAQQHKLLGEGGDLFVQTNNLLVKPFAVGSAFSPKDGKNRLVLSDRLRLRRGVVLQPRWLSIRFFLRTQGGDTENSAYQQTLHEPFSQLVPRL
jgi:hypothetical protein